MKKNFSITVDDVEPHGNLPQSMVKMPRSNENIIFQEFDFEESC